MLFSLIFVTLVIHVQKASGTDCLEGFEKHIVSGDLIKCCKSCPKGQPVIEVCHSDYTSNVCGYSTTETNVDDTTSTAYLILSTIATNAYISFSPLSHTRSPVATASPTSVHSLTEGKTKTDSQTSSATSFEFDSGLIFLSTLIYACIYMILR